MGRQAVLKQGFFNGDMGMIYYTFVAEYCGLGRVSCGTTAYFRGASQVFTLTLGKAIH
jgi:hypothetical protein